MQPGQQCPGKRLLDGGLVGICILCNRQDDKARGNPPAEKTDSGRWVCASLVAPAGWGAR